MPVLELAVSVGQNPTPQYLLHSSLGLLRNALQRRLLQKAISHPILEREGDSVPQFLQFPSLT